jgi:hypothetical protein
VVDLSAELDELPPDRADRRTRAYSATEFWLPGVLLVTGLALTLLWIGFLGWFAYRLLLS